MNPDASSLIGMPRPGAACDSPDTGDGRAKRSKRAQGVSHAQGVSRAQGAAAERERRAAATLADPRWARVLARDRAADQAFVYSVDSTGVYCRPSCGARPARPENVRFHATPADARQAGFRACLRCRPDEGGADARRARWVARACRLIEQADEPPTLAALARALGLSASHAQRGFKAATGLSPREYAAALRAGRMRAQLAGGASVTEAIHAAGYSSSSRFYERSDDLLGMTASRYRAGGERMRIAYACAPCSLGVVLAARGERGICAILIGDDEASLATDLRRRFPKADLAAASPDFNDAMTRVVAMIEAPRAGLDLPLDVRGTAFQQRVWQALRAIPAGQTVSYAELAARIGAPGATRAVAGACAANPLAVAIPCHRVVRGDGSLSGYRWGPSRKRALLAREEDR